MLQGATSSVFPALTYINTSERAVANAVVPLHVMIFEFLSDIPGKLYVSMTRLCCTTFILRHIGS